MPKHRFLIRKPNYFAIWLSVNKEHIFSKVYYRRPRRIVHANNAGKKIPMRLIRLRDDKIIYDGFDLEMAAKVALADFPLLDKAKAELRRNELNYTLSGQLKEKSRP